MVAITKILATLSLAAAASAEYLAVIETQPTYRVGSASMGSTVGCQDGAKTYSIEAFEEHPGQVNSGCSWKGRHVASAKKKRLEGSNGGYQYGWGVCITSYGGNVHNGLGQHQRCHTDDTTLLNCPNNMPCWTSITRVLKCGPDWWPDHPEAK